MLVKLRTIINIPISKNVKSRLEALLDNNYAHPLCSVAP